MSLNGTFRSVVRPNKVLVTTDLAGILSFATRATSLVISSGQSQHFTSTSNTQHLIPNQVVDITNKSGATIYIAASLMEQDTLIDIENNTTVALVWTDNGKFYDLGGSSTVKNITDDLTILTTRFNSHRHDGTFASKVRATDLDPVGGSPGQFLLLNGSGQPSWFDPLSGTAESFAQVRSTNSSLNINQSPGVEIPYGGTIDSIDSARFQVSGNGIRVLNYSGWIEVHASVAGTSSVEGACMDMQVYKNGVVTPGISTTTNLPKFSVSTRLTGYIFKRIQVVANDVITVVTTRSGATGTVTLNGPDSTFSVINPSSGLARGPQGEPGNPNWSFLSGNGSPSTSLGVFQDVYLDKVAGDLYRKIGSSTWQLEANIKGPTGPVGTSRYMSTRVKSGTLTNNTEEWFPSAGIGFTKMLPGRITHMSLSLGTAGASSKTVEILKNGISTGQSITVGPNIAKGNVALVSPVTFVAGDVISFRTVLAGGASNGAVAIMCELT